ncbi:hypothetical protein C8F01DRAFT_1089319 [Mycena amicta]|nr:hypothetical protein C8F01DRAFT_1089319 [Mycena amicta]
MNHPLHTTFSHVPGYPDAYFVLATQDIHDNPTPESTSDVKSPKARLYTLQTPVTRAPTLLEMISPDAVFTNGPFPHIQIFTPKLLTGMSIDQIERVRANPAKHFAVIPHGSEASLLTPALRNCIVRFLTTLGFQGRAESLELELPAGTRYPGTWAMLLSRMNDEMYRLLPYQQTFAISPELAFHVVPFNARPCRHHTICALTRDNNEFTDSPRTKVRVLAAIRAGVWSSDDFKRINAETMRNRAIEGDEKSLAIAIAIFLDIHYAPPSGHHPAMMVIICRSFARTEVEQGRWTRSFNRLIINPLVLDGDRLRRAHRTWVCEGCKSYLHHRNDCDFEAIPGWRGPIRINPIQAVEEELGQE